jgi:exopolysaccharide production protein ExoQ
MKDGSAAIGRQASFLKAEPALIGAVFFLAPFITLIAPRTTIGALVLVSVVTIALALMHGQSARELFRFDLGLALFAAIAVYLLINATWSLDTSRALNKAALFAAVVIMTYGAVRAMAAWSQQQIRIASLAFVAGAIVGAVYILIQIATDLALTRLLFNVFPDILPESGKGIKIRDGRVVSIKAYGLNRSVATMLLAFWPALLCLTQLRSIRWRSYIIVGLCLAMAAVATLSEHETSQIGLIVSIVVFLFARFWPVGAKRGMWAAWCLAFVLVVPLSALAFKAQLHEAGWLPYSARERIVLWAYRADNIPQAPVFGIGAASSPKLLEVETPPTPTKLPAGSPYKWHAGWHAHNGFLEVWFELGMVGVILLLAAGCAVIGYIGRLSPEAQPYILALFAAYCIVLAFGWGIWQTWLMALPGLAAIYAALATSLSPSSNPSLSSSPMPAWTA